MDYSKFLGMLKHLDDSLDKEDVVVLKFLCMDVIKTSKLDSVRDSLDLFYALESCEAIAPGQLQILAELLYEAQRIDLMKATGITQEELKILIEKNGHKLSAYRRMLHQLSEYMITDDVRQLKHIMRTTPHMQRSRLEEAPNAYALFALLERLELISPGNVSELLKLTDQMDEAGLSRIVSQYIDEHCTQSTHTQDVSVQASSVTAERASLQVPEYPIRRGKGRGLCVIVNNDEFKIASNQFGCKKELEGPRVGSSVDAEALCKVFGETLQFKVELYQNLSRGEMLNKMRELATWDHSSIDVFVCCILTHGEAGSVFGVDCLPVSIYSILSKFKPKHCPTLDGKPKIFLIQACQGMYHNDDSMQSIPLEDGAGATSDEQAAAVDLEADFTGKLSRLTSIPRQPDYFLGLATVPGFVSYRSRTKGTWYMQALCQMLTKYHNSTDFLSIVTEVNNKVTQKVQKRGDIHATQIPLPQYTLRKRVYFRTC